MNVTNMARQKKTQPDKKGKLKNQFLEPNRDLLAWEKWTVIRKEEVNHLASRTQRPAADLTMNLLENKREDKERKIALEYAQVPIKPKIRGQTVWEQPERLRQNCSCEPVYEVQRTAAELGRPPVIEHVGVPAYIQAAEKGLLGTPTRKPCTQLDADYVQYRENREYVLKKKLKKIDPFRPDVRELIVKGEKAIKPPVPKLHPAPEITIDLPSHEKDFVDSIYAVRINNTVICKEIPGQNTHHIQQMKESSWHERCTSWTYYFNVPLKRAGRSKFFIKNLGTTALRYCWKRIRRPLPFIPDDFYTQVFFFNKNEDVLPPGQEKEMLITFISDEPGIYSEFWELSFCNICFFDTLADKFVINLYGDSVENIDEILRKTAILRNRIERKTLYYNMKRILQDIIVKATTIELQIYPYKKLFLEAEMFQMKNPVCYYHQTEVKKLKDIYLEMEPGEQWNLSIVKWREVMIRKDFDERMMYYEFLRKSHSDLLKPWYEGDSLLKHKYSAVKWLLGQLADKFSQVRKNIYDNLDVKRDSHVSSTSATRGSSQKISEYMDPEKRCMVKMLFYVQMQEHVAMAMDAIAGVLSSIDLNRWMEFDFCRF